jgi:hypothetical protein
MEISLRALPGTGLPDEMIVLDRFDDGLLFSDGSGERLFAVNILLVPSRFERMPMIGHRQHDGVDIGPRHHLPVIVVGFAVVVLLLSVDGCERFREVILVDVRTRQHLTIGLAHEVAGVARALHSPTDHPHGNPVGWGRTSVSPEGTAGNDGGYGNRGSGDGQKTTTRDWRSVRRRLHSGCKVHDPSKVFQ